MDDPPAEAAPPAPAEEGAEEDLWARVMLRWLSQVEPTAEPVQPHADPAEAPRLERDLPDFWLLG